MSAENRPSKKFKMNKICLLFLLLPIVTFYSCTASRSSLNESDYSISEIIYSINKNSEKLNTLKGEGVISIDSPEMSSSGSFTLSIVKPDSLYIKLEGPFGVSIAAIMLERNRFVYYNIQENRVITAPSTATNIKAVMRLKLDFDDFINGFSGSYNFIDTNSQNFSLARNEDNLVLTQKTSEETKKYFLDPEKRYIRQYNVYDKEGKEKMVVEYSNFSEENGYYFPNKIKISRTASSEYVFLDYSSKELNKGYLGYKIKYPKSAKVIEW
jgi:outer membrane lipoprotein-sorting protein